MEHRIEAVYWKWFSVFAEHASSVDKAVAGLVDGEEQGYLSSVGVFVDGEPHLCDVWVNPHTPDEAEAAEMREAYAKIGRPAERIGR